MPLFIYCTGQADEAPGRRVPLSPEVLRPVGRIQHRWREWSHCQSSLNKRLPNQRIIEQKGVREKEKG